MAVGPCAAVRDSLLRKRSSRHLAPLPRDRSLTLADIRAPTQAKVLFLGPSKSSSLAFPRHSRSAQQRELVVILAWSELIKAVYSDDPRRRQWAADKILSNWAARNHPLAAARHSAATDATVIATLKPRQAESDGEVGAADEGELDGLKTRRLVP